MILGILLFLMINSSNLFAERSSLKILHLALHKGCINDFEQVCDELGYKVTNWYIHDTPQLQFCGKHVGNDVYNITNTRATAIWTLHKDFFNEFDLIVTSDTAPLSRIFLQNGWNKPLIIWVCNRFDYADLGTAQGLFPDRGYYDIFREATQKPNVKIISYTDYEHHYARAHGIEVGTRTINPIGVISTKITTSNSAIPDSINKQETLFLYPRLEPNQLNYITHAAENAGIKTYSGIYNGPDDLVNFKGVLYFPYAWSNLALFENIQRGIVHFVPSEHFIRELAYQHKPVKWCTLNRFDLCDWYATPFRDCMVYFDSWDDLQHKVQSTNYQELSCTIILKAQAHRHEMLRRWKKVFHEVEEYTNSIMPIN